MADGDERAVKAGEQATPHGELPAEHGAAGLDTLNRAPEALPLWRVARSLAGVPDAAQGASHEEGAPDIVDYAVRARLAPGVHSFRDTGGTKREKSSVRCGGGWWYCNIPVLGGGGGP